MNMLLSFIKFNHKNYDDLDDGHQKKQVEILASKLKPLENEILQNHQAQITIMNSGNIFIDSFPPELSDKIKALI